VKFCARGALSFDEATDDMLDRKDKVADTLLTAYLQEA
jgi:hypothetical protein